MDRIDAMHAFVRVVELERMADVADELRVKQSTVSKWLSRLEEELGVTLLVRTTRAKHLTEEGERFYARSKQILAAYEAATEEVRRQEPTLRGDLRISAPVVFGQLHVVPILARFLRKHPALRVELSLADRYVNLVEERFDLAVRVGAPVDSSAIGHRLGSTGRKLVASPGYLRRRGAPESVEQLRHHECLHPVQTGPGMRWTFRRAGRARAVLVRGRFCADHSDALRAMARAGLGVALLADWLVDDDVRRGRLVPLLEDHDASPAPIRALTPPGREPTRRARAFLDFARAELPDELNPLR